MTDDIAAIKLNIKKYTTTKICEIIVSTRYLGLDEDLTIFCMQELARRRIEDNDEFAFEEFIESELGKLPVLDFKLPDFRELLANATSLIKSGKL